jgi:hypothetical protein
LICLDPPPEFAQVGLGWIRGANLRRGQLFEADPTNKEPFA